MTYINAILSDRFFTLCGLKVRLDLNELFIKHIVRNELSTEKAEKTILTFLASIDMRVLFPSMFKWIFTMISICLPSIGIKSYIYATVGIYIIARLISLVPSNFFSAIRGLFSSFTAAFAILVKTFGFLPYLISLLPSIITKRFNIFIAFLILSFALHCFDIILNGVLVKRTFKKYGLAFGYIELMTFDEARLQMPAKISFNKLVSSYSLTKKSEYYKT